MSNNNEVHISAGGHFSPHSIPGFLQAHGHDPELDKPDPEPAPREPGEVSPLAELASLLVNFKAENDLGERNE